MLAGNSGLLLLFGLELNEPKALDLRTLQNRNDRVNDTLGAEATD